MIVRLLNIMNVKRHIFLKSVPQQIKILKGYFDKCFCVPLCASQAFMTFSYFKLKVFCATHLYIRVC